MQVEGKLVSGFRGLGFRVWGLGFRGLGFRGSGFRGLGFRVSSCDRLKHYRLLWCFHVPTNKSDCIRIYSRCS